MATKTLTKAADGTTVEVRPGERIVIQLPENPTTGYRWDVETADDRVVSKVSHDYGKGGAADPGAGSNVKLVFEARAPGEGSIRLKRWREWEGEASVKERYGVQVRVLPE